MGHIELAAPVTHIWLFKGVPSRLGYLLDMSPKELEKVIYFAAYLITHIDDTRRQKDLPELEETCGPRSRSFMKVRHLEGGPSRAARNRARPDGRGWRQEPGDHRPPQGSRA